LATPVPFVSLVSPDQIPWFGSQGAASHRLIVSATGEDRPPDASAAGTKGGITGPPIGVRPGLRTPRRALCPMKSMRVICACGMGQACMAESDAVTTARAKFVDFLSRRVRTRVNEWW